LPKKFHISSALVPVILDFWRRNYSGVRCVSINIETLAISHMDIMAFGLGGKGTSFPALLINVNCPGPSSSLVVCINTT
jgi:hypothetical protein